MRGSLARLGDWGGRGVAARLPGGGAARAAVPALLLLGLWSAVSGGAVPSPAAVLRQMRDDGWAFYAPALGGTLGRASLGFLCGNAAAFLLASLATLLPGSRRLVVHLGTVSASVPVIVVGPLLALAFGAEVTTVALAALAVFFNTLLALLAGFAAAGAETLDLFQAYGAGRWRTFTRLQLVACLPSLFAALALAAPAAILGAILGEWLGGAQAGLGTALVVAMQQLDPARVWGIALACGGAASLAYWLILRAGRAATAWAPSGR